MFLTHTHRGRDIAFRSLKGVYANTELFLKCKPGIERRTAPSASRDLRRVTWKAYVIRLYHFKFIYSLPAFTYLMTSIKHIIKSTINRQTKHTKPYYHNLQYKPFSTKQTLDMPLIVPGITSQDPASKTEEWTNKLVGKKIGEGSSDATVCYPEWSFWIEVYVLIWGFVDFCTSRSS